MTETAKPTEKAPEPVTIDYRARVHKIYEGLVTQRGSHAALTRADWNIINAELDKWNEVKPKPVEKKD